jgi:hypothetical protein
MKIVVFDLDETLGYFTEYGIFWDCLSNYINLKRKDALTQQDFNEILDLFPEFLRPNIINILTYLKSKKHSKCCHKMLIYTNNQGPKEWAKNIITYFENKIKTKLFNQIISAFKVNGKLVEICRTTHSKTHQDLMKCTRIPEDAEICFLDDTYYPEMANDNIYYINVKPYYYDLNFEDMITIFENSKYGKKIIDNDSDFNEYMMAEFKRYKYDIIKKDPKEYEIDKLLSKQIIIHLKDFFKRTNKDKVKHTKTQKNIFSKKNKTQRNKY